MAADQALRIVDLVEEYFRQRTEGSLDARYFRRQMELLGKNPDEITDILVELDDDWQKELAFQSEIKNSPYLMIGGLVLGIGLCVLTIMGALGFLFQGNVFVLFYGGIIGGFSLAIKGYFARKMVRLRADRRRIKYTMY